MLRERVNVITAVSLPRFFGVDRARFVARGVLPRSHHYCFVPDTHFRQLESIPSNHHHGEAARCLLLLLVLVVVASGPSRIIIVRHGERLEHLDSRWALSAERPTTRP